MYCRNCGKEIPDEAVVCIGCGVNSKTGNKYCQNCGAETNFNAEICTKCGVRLFTQDNPEAKSKLVAGLLGVLFLGTLGIHRFYLGYIYIGIAQLILAFMGVFTCGISTIVAWVWGLIEGILILTGNNITTDSNGVPLKE